MNSTTAKSPSHFSPEYQLKTLVTNAAEVISEAELFEKLKVSHATGKPLIVKLGADPSRPDLHLGHKVVIDKLRQFQDFGHKVVFIIGDFTGMIGDPTGRSKHRVQLTREETIENARTYQEQIYKVLIRGQTQVVFNSDWLSPLALVDVIQLMASVSLQQMQVRDDFAKRRENGVPVFMHELPYPLMQAYDSLYEARLLK